MREKAPFEKVQCEKPKNLQLQRAKRQQHGAKNKSCDVGEQRLQQFAALYQLRLIKDAGVDDGNDIHSLLYADLENEQFKNITAVDVRRLRIITASLTRIVDKRAVAVGAMRRALTAEQYTTYTDCLGHDFSHSERNESDDMPLELHEYMQQIILGDQYMRTANLFKRKSRKYGKDGKTAVERWEDKALGCYEEAVMDLCNIIEKNPTRNPFPDALLTSKVLRLLDREASAEHGRDPYADAQGVPRVRGSKSKYVQVRAQPVVGKRLRKYWLQREALSNAALELMYEMPADAEIPSEQQPQVSEKISKLLRLGLDDEQF